MQEYAKLPLYDGETFQQPHLPFMCHQADGRICAGWAGCRDTNHLLALRFVEVNGSMDPDELEATLDYVSPVPLWSSGREAALHGLARIGDPDERARKLMAQLQRKIEQ